MEEGVQSQLNMQELETKITDMKLNSSWTKKTEVFVNLLAHLMADHASADKANTCDDNWYIQRFKTALSYDAEFRQHFNTHDMNLASLCSMAQTIQGMQALAAKTYVQFLTRIQAQAIVIDNANCHANVTCNQQA